MLFAETPGDWMVRADLMERIMSFTVRELRVDELQKVSGGSNEVAVFSVGGGVAKGGTSNYEKKNVTTIHYAPVVLR